MQIMAGLRNARRFEGATVFVALVALSAGFTCAQTVDQPPSFEVAAIKPTETTVAGMRLGPVFNHGKLVITNFPLRSVVAAAFGLSEDRVFGPAWLDGKRFDFLAKAPEGVQKTEIKPLLQSLLKDRFRLESHIELREFPVYDLVIARNGIKMVVYPAEAREPVGTSLHGASVRGARMTMSQFATTISKLAGRPVIDKTGLSEEYALILKFAPSPQLPRGDRPDLPLPELPDLFTAMQEQLGLKLQPARARIEVVVVDHMDPMPSEN
jgi:uncharacterized protein (TIGR03435 family)